MAATMGCSRAPLAGSEASRLRVPSAFSTELALELSKKAG